MQLFIVMKIRIKIGSRKPWSIEKSDIDGVGVFAAKFMPKNTKIELAAFVTPTAPTAGPYKITEFGSKLNHQANSNSELRLEPDNSYWLYSTEDVEKGTELVVNYKKNPKYFSKLTKGFIEKNPKI